MEESSCGVLDVRLRGQSVVLASILGLAGSIHSSTLRLLETQRYIRTLN